MMKSRRAFAGLAVLALSFHFYVGGEASAEPSPISDAEWAKSLAAPMKEIPLISQRDAGAPRSFRGCPPPIPGGRDRSVPADCEPVMRFGSSPLGEEPVNDGDWIVVPLESEVTIPAPGRVTATVMETSVTPVDSTSTATTVTRPTELEQAASTETATTPPMISTPTAPTYAPISTGFKALGLTGKVDGPGGKGNGTYRLEKNDPYEIQLRVRTGFIDGLMILTRDPADGKDMMRFVGKLWDDDHDRWGPEGDNSQEVQISYDPKQDRGAISWTENGQRKEERYWNGGREGRRAMTIEFGGGWDHDFYPDNK